MTYESAKFILSTVIFGGSLVGLLLVCYGLFKAYIRRSIK